MYTGSYTDYSMTEGQGTVILCAVAMWIMIATIAILPIVMAVKFNCSNKKAIIVMHIMLLFLGGIIPFFVTKSLPVFILPILSIPAFILIAVSKRKSQYYEDDGKNIVWIQSGLYALNMLVLLLPMVKFRISSKYEIDGMTKFNILYLNRLYETKEVFFIVALLIGIPLVGLLLNFILRDARKILPLNIVIVYFNSIFIYFFAEEFFSNLCMPGVAILFGGIADITSAILLYVITIKISYTDN